MHTETSTSSHPQALLGEVQVTAILAKVKYPGLEFETMTEFGRPFLRVTCPGGVDTQTGECWSWNGRWWRLSPHMTVSEVVGTAFKAVITALEHEARESFLYKGQPIYDAHLDVEQLAKVRAGKGSLDAR